MNESGDDDRDAILARRRALVATALAGLVGVSACGDADEGKPTVCLAVPLEFSAPVAPTPCLTAAPVEPPAPPHSAPEDAGAPDAPDAGAAPCLSVERADAGVKPPPQTPRPCLTTLPPPQPPPRPCLKPVQPKKTP